MGNYANFDHAHWVEKSTKTKLSPLGAVVANILGYVGHGIYNAPLDVCKVDWTNPDYIKVSWRHALCNWDFDELSRLWVECHRRMVRVEIAPLSNKTLQLLFHQRFNRAGDTTQRLPDCEEMIQRVDQDYGRPTKFYLIMLDDLQSGPSLKSRWQPNYRHTVSPDGAGHLIDPVKEKQAMDLMPVMTSHPASADVFIQGFIDQAYKSIGIPTDQPTDPPADQATERDTHDHFSA